MFIHGEVDEVDIIYTYFKSAMVQIPRTVPILPVQPRAKDALEVQGRKCGMQMTPRIIPP